MNAGAYEPAVPVDAIGCAKQVFEKRGTQGAWRVHECEAGSQLRYRVVFGGQAHGHASVVIAEPDGIVDVGYRLVGPETLLIDAAAERGGQAFLLHPVAGSDKLSVAAFDYHGGDEESLVVRQDGARIRASTAHGAHVFSVDPKGQLVPVPQARGGKAKGR
jgi:hypothetical protein